jgi:hypothetical protein
LNLPWAEGCMIQLEPIRYKLAYTVVMYLVVNKRKRKTSKRKILYTRSHAPHEKLSV